MKPFGPFDAVGNIALEIARMSGFQQGQADFDAKRYEEPEELPFKSGKVLTPMQHARSEGYLDGWLSAQVSFYKKLTEKAS